MKQKSLYRKGLSGGKKFGPPPKKGPTPQGLNISYNTIISFHKSSVNFSDVAKNR